MHKDREPGRIVRAVISLTCPTPPKENVDRNARILGGNPTQLDIEYAYDEFVADMSATQTLASIESATPNIQSPMLKPPTPTGINPDTVLYTRAVNQKNMWDRQTRRREWILKTGAKVHGLFEHPRNPQAHA